MPGTSSAKTRFALLPGHDDASLSIRLLTDETMPAYDNQNIFAKILRGEIPCYKVYENQQTLAFLDIMPRLPGIAASVRALNTAPAIQLATAPANAR